MENEQERLLPIANVGRIMKKILPERAKISKEAKQTMQECASEFISFVTAEASDKCHKEKRRTINGEDVCWALSSLGFDIYTEAMLKYLHKFREFERKKAIQNKASNDKDAEGKDDDDEASNSSNIRASTSTATDNSDDSNLLLQPAEKLPQTPMTIEFIHVLEKDPKL